ncbi:MAG: ABC transporter permease [Treponema sp.]|nr:ABC transporter permease [Treponema sp.]
MLQHLLKRFVFLIFVFFIISIIVFIVFQQVPGDRAQMQVGAILPGMTPEEWNAAIERARAELALDRAYPVQYAIWMRNVLTFNFGRSIYYHMDVIDVVRPAMANTIKLNIFVMFFVFIITIPLGIITAVRKGSTLDNVVQVGTIVGVSIPIFIWGILFILIFAIFLNILPISGAGTVGFQGTGFARLMDQARFMVLPVLTLTFASLASITRYVRSGMIEALRQDYVRTARAKGVREKVVIYSHAFRNSMIPLVNITIAWTISLFGGSMIVENVFSWPGMGRITLDALHNRDFNVSFTMILFYVVLALLANLLMDIAYTLVDPRAKFN